ncbi:LytTR family DNA-binding domain-containing protein [Spirosoma daeguense]
MNILIIEDEEPTARKLKRLVQEIEPTANLVGQTGSVEESVAWLRQNGINPALRPDVILMDIELADGQSFAIFNQTTVQCPVIFTTAYDEFAIQAFKVNSIDYLLKPIKAEDLRRAFAKLQTLAALFANRPDALQQQLTSLLTQLAGQSNRIEPAVSDPLPVRSRFLVKQGQRLIPLETDEIAYFFTRNRLSFARTHHQQEWMLDYTMDELANMLDTKRFIRLNRQVIAELRAIEKVQIHFNGKLKISLRPAFDEEVMVSREKAAEFKIWLGE